MMYGYGGGLGFFIWVLFILLFWYVGILILRWVLGTNQMIDELKKQNETLIEILKEIQKNR
ncbi:hypothetical protein [uncultured Cetobacterium sp.]|uniref:hypothetical protein n=1 Tax=uncultured Cetobacterium sp. TaxID=527638 RepID=UPI002628D8DA|nr:hypothetical protein [uncultured Cetobacterium sp.]